MQAHTAGSRGWFVCTKNIRTLYVAAMPFARSKDRLTPCPSVNPPCPSVNPPLCSHASCILLPCFLKHTNAASTAPNKPHRPFVTRACHVPCAAACPYTTHTWTRVDRTRARIDQRNKTHHKKSLHVRYSPTLSENSRHHPRAMCHVPLLARTRPTHGRESTEQGRASTRGTKHTTKSHCTYATRQPCPRIHVTTLARHTCHARDAAALTAVLLEAGSTLEIPGPSELRDAYFLAATSNREFTSPPSLGTLVMLATQPLSPPCYLQPPTAHRRVDLQAIFQVSRRCFPTESLANRPCVTCVAELAAIHLATLHRCT